MTSDYVFINSSACEVINEEYQIKLGTNNNRPQTQIIELISIALSSAEEQPFIQVRTDFSASNYYGNDHYSPCLAILTKDYSTATVHNYIINCTESPKFNITNTNQFAIAFYGPDLIITPNEFVLIFKITTPAQGALQAEYRAQIPL